MKRAAFAAAGLAAATSALFLLAPGPNRSEAQDPPPQPPRQGGPDELQRRPFPGAMMMQGTLVAQGKHLFVLMGGTLYKIDPDTMVVVKKLELIPAMDPRARERQPEGGGRERPQRN